MSSHLDVAPMPPLETTTSPDGTGILEAALDRVFPNLAGEPLAGLTIPQPYRSLLVHDQDMTSTLESHHGESLSLEVLSLTVEEDLLCRTVLLVGDETGRPRELGAITIHLHRFAAGPRDEILAGEKPLGAILGDHGIAYLSRPEEFLKLQSTPEISRAFRLPAERHLEEPVPLYGRRNALRTPRGEILADVLEILPPI